MFNLSLGVTKSVVLPRNVRAEGGISFTNARSAELGGCRTGQVSLRVRF
jgi:hypothetical protein